MTNITQKPAPANEEERLASRVEWLETENKGLLESVRGLQDKVAKLKAESILQLLEIKKLKEAELHTIP